MFRQKSRPAGRWSKLLKEGINQTSNFHHPKKGNNLLDSSKLKEQDGLGGGADWPR
jgi:hypothetical protein